MQVVPPGPPKAASPVAAFEEAMNAQLKALHAAYNRLEQENLELKQKLAATSLRLAVYEPMEEPPFTQGSLPTSPITVLSETSSSSTAPASGAQSSKFRAVKDFLFKPKSKEKADPPELWSGPEKASKKEKGSHKKKTDRWVFTKMLEGHTKPVDEIALCAYDPYVIGTCSRDGSARLWTLDSSGSATFSGHNGTVNSIRIHGLATSRAVCTAGADGTVQIFKIPLFMMHQRSPKELRVSRRSSGNLAGVDSPYMSPDQSDDDSVSATPPHTPRMVTPRGSSVPALVTPPVEVKSTVSLPVVSVFSEHTDNVVACDWIPGTDYLVSGSKDKTLKYINANTMQASSIEVQFPAGDDEPHLTNVYAHPSQPLVIAPGTDGLARVWDMRELKLVDMIAHSSDKGSVTHALFSHDGGLIITGGEDRLVKLWDSRNTQTPLDAIRCGSIQSKFSLSQLTNSLAIPKRDGKLKICDTQGHSAGNCETHKQHKEALTAAVWSEDEANIFTSSLDDRYNVIVWTRDFK